ncbi:type II toxin-antitoxin system VapC family toxin [Methylobacterium sp. 092160098-2]|uniref:type II toxin-antitoxin system VapC family toxin n=1 Tax=Methylobacterium sp. 092160098-2 TaxID=3025129 RepID=UPI002381CB97|nr:type II toxin-antitoxin system VapC family toxin [Methylobacterium sp. 092160098-2]MDE4916083.1 type II toxin-antitoxin system VapC family toxin [Methylobacterium sp. 092160098-2]
MACSVLDASALLAYLRQEPGWEQLLQAFTGTATMTTVNFGEVAGWMIRNGADEPAVRALRTGLVFPLTPVDDDLAIRAGLLEPLTRFKGLGIGDRLCLALAARSGAVALTANAAWQEIAKAAGVDVRLIR